MIFYGIIHIKHKNNNYYINYMINLGCLNEKKLETKAQKIYHDK